jgi:phosphoglycerate dehydrogenase-like enzyme
MLPQQLHREWKKLPQNTGVVHLPEAAALVVGVGGIGSEVARLCAAFGMRVIGVDERRRDKPPGVAELHRGDELDALLPTADFVVLTVPHTPETEEFMNRVRFQEMKKTAFFINIGRGMTTRLDDLVRHCALARSPAPGSTSSNRSRCLPTTRCGQCRVFC